MSQTVESIEFIDAGELAPWEHVYRNASSTHRCSDQELRRSIEGHGLKTPLVAMRLDERLFILDGARRWRVLLESRELVPVVVLERLTPEAAVVRSFHTDPLCREDAMERMYFVNQLVRFRHGKITSSDISDLLLLSVSQVRYARDFPLAQLDAQALRKLSGTAVLEDGLLQRCQG